MMFALLCFVPQLSRRIRRRMTPVARYIHRD